MRPGKNLVLLLVGLFCVNMAFAQDRLIEAIHLLNQNNRKEASAALQQLISDPAAGANARLALCLLELNNEHFDAAWEQFNHFFAVAPDPYPYVYALWSSGVFGDVTPANEKAVNAFMQSLLKDAKANATLKALAMQFLSTVNVQRNDFSTAKEYAAGLNDVKNWGSVGSFDNTSSSGFNKEFGPLAQPEASASFKNSKGAPVKWFTIQEARTDRWLDLDYTYDISNSIIYTQTFLNSPADQEVQLLCGVSGSIKIWVNDFLVASESEERNTDLDVYNYVVKLNKGYNRILLQVGNSELDNSNFMVRLADAKGNVLDNLSSTAVYQPYTKAVAYTVQPVPLAVEQFFEAKVQKDPKDFLDMYMLTNVYLHNDKRYEARHMAMQLKQLYPMSTLVSIKMMQAYAKDNNKTDLTKEIESVKTNDSSSLYGIQLRYDEVMNNEDYDKAAGILKEWENGYGVSRETELKELGLLAKKNMVDKLMKLVDELYEKYPNDYSCMSMKFLIERNAVKDLPKSLSVLKKFLSNNYSSKANNSLIELYVEMGKKDDAFRLYNKMINDCPYSTGTYNDVASSYFSLKDYAQALLWQQKAIDRAPYFGSYLYSKGLILDAMNRKEEAIASLKQCLQYNPTNYNARKKLRELEGKKDLFSNFKTTDAYALFKQAPQSVEYPNDNCIYLLKEMQQVVYPENGASEEKNELLVKVFNQSGVDGWKSVSIPYNDFTQRLVIEKAELFKKDGSKVEAEVNSNQIVFSSLAVNDAVHVTYRLENYNGGRLAEHFWDDFYFNGYLPIKLARYSLLVPSGKKFQYKAHNTGIQPTVNDVDDYKLYVWQSQDAAAIKEEAYMPYLSDVGERVEVSSIPDWTYVANWYADLSSVKAKADFEVKEAVKQLFVGKTNLTEQQKATIIYTYIEENFSYSDVPFLHSAFTPQRASRTITTRLGDCKDLATLFVSMAREVGLNASLVLVDTRDNGDSDLVLPSIGFNHCIASVQLGGKRYLVELTDNRLPFGSMGQMLYHTNGLYIPLADSKTRGELVKLEADVMPLNDVQRNATVAFKGSQMEIVRSSVRTGGPVSGIRSEYSDLGQEDREKRMSNAIAGEFNKKVMLKDLTFTNLENKEDVVTLKYSFVVDNGASEMLGMQIFKLPWSDAFHSLDFVSLDKRTYPFNMWYFSSTKVDHEVMTVTLPVGKKLVEIPKPVVLTSPVLDYALTFTVKADKLVADRRLTYKKEYVSPQEYDAMKEMVGKVNEADGKQLGFK